MDHRVEGLGSGAGVPGRSLLRCAVHAPLRAPGPVMGRTGRRSTAGLASTVAAFQTTPQPHQPAPSVSTPPNAPGIGHHPRFPHDRGPNFSPLPYLIPGSASPFFPRPRLAPGSQVTVGIPSP